MALEQRKIIRWGQRIGILALGLTTNAAMVYGYDFFVYPYLIATYGFWLGLFYAIPGSTVLCLLSLWFYNVTKQDWLGIETIKRLRDESAKGKIRKFLHRIANKGDILSFLFLSLRHDAFIVTVYMRRGNGNYSMSVRDWKIFWASMLVADVWWGLLVFGAIEAFREWLMPFVPSSILNWLGSN